MVFGSIVDVVFPGAKTTFLNGNVRQYSQSPHEMMIGLNGFISLTYQGEGTTEMS